MYRENGVLGKVVDLGKGNGSEKREQVPDSVRITPSPGEGVIHPRTSRSYTRDEMYTTIAYSIQTNI